VRSPRYLLALVLVLVVQATVFADMPVFGVRADVVVLAGIAAALVGGAEQGAVVGFVAGLAFDLVHPAPWPLGLSALAYSLAAYLVGWLHAGGLAGVRAAAPLSALAGSVAGLVLFAGLGEMLDHGGLLTGRLVVVAAVVAAVNAALIRPALRLARWTLPSATTGVS
jgi:hypothetical protein